MGLLTHLLILPVAPVHGAFWAVGQVVRAAEEEYYDPAPVRRELHELERALLEGRIDEEAFERREDELLDLLEEREEARRRLRAGS